VAGLYLGHTTHSGLEDDRDDTLNQRSIMTTFLLEVIVIVSGSPIQSEIFRAHCEQQT